MREVSESKRLLGDISRGRESLLKTGSAGHMDDTILMKRSRIDSSETGDDKEEDQDLRRSRAESITDIHPGLARLYCTCFQGTSWG